jgi:hypothetical protein
VPEAVFGNTRQVSDTRPVPVESLEIPSSVRITNMIEDISETEDEWFARRVVRKTFRELAGPVGVVTLDDMTRSVRISSLG